MAGPLQGLKVIEMAGIGPGPFCAMLFADMGADVVRVERPGTRRNPNDILARGRSVLQVDLRAEGASAARPAASEPSHASAAAAAAPVLAAPPVA